MSALSHPAAREWSLQDGVTYLNHGSFGPSPRPVLAERQKWTERLEREPMDFFVRQFEDHIDAAREVLGRFVGTPGRNLVFVDNATFGMNVVAQSFPLSPGHEVLATDHEYGAVLRIWRRACQRSGAVLKSVALPRPLESVDGLLDSLFDAVTPQTRLLVVSHVTSPTAVVLPVKEICGRAKQAGIPVCIDGPHAPAAVDVRIPSGCDYYVASCHKWLSAPFGSGFLYVHPRRQQQLEPSVMSWGASLSGKPRRWSDELVWSGTRDPAPFLSVPAAIAFLEQVGLDDFRRHSRSLIELARERITALTRLEPIVPQDCSWSSTMLSLPLPDSVGETPPNHMHPLQAALWEKHRIEVPIVNWGGRRWVRVSAHLYNSADDIDQLARALAALL